MKKLYIFAALLMALGCAPAVRAESTDVLPQIVIAAIQTGRIAATGDDYVVLHNNSNSAVDLTGWKLQYRAANGTGTSSWTTKSTFACAEQISDCKVTIGARGNLVVSTYEIPGVASQKLASGFSDVGGQIRIVQTIPATSSDVVVADMVGYGTAVSYEGVLPAPPPPAGQIIGRKSDDADLLIDTNSNGTDFTVGCLVPTMTGSAEVSPCIIEQAVNEDAQDPAQEQTTGAEITPTYAPLVITELLPDPESPALDSRDEYIELYNPTNEPVLITGYTLEAGPDFRYRYALGELTIPAGSYYAVYSAESHLSLTNAGTAVRVLNPAGDVLDSVASYGQAKPGQAWAKVGDSWQWSTVPTPGAPNSIVAEVAKPLAAAAAKKVAAAPAKKTTAASKTTSSAAKTAAAKPAKAEAASGSPPQQDTTTTLNYIILGVAGLGVLGYVCYEYRQEFGRVWAKIKNLFSRRKVNDPEPTLQTD